MMALQTVNGKAFEYSLLEALRERLSERTNVIVVEDRPYLNSKQCFESLSEKDKSHNALSSSFAVNFLMDIEPRLSHDLGVNDVLQLEIVADREGQSGDVRDVLAIRALQKWEIGISAKNNHRAVKHSRLSNTIDFGEKWMGLPCSNEYFQRIHPVFDHLEKLRAESNGRRKWSSLGDYHTSVYSPILEAFRDELIRIDTNNPGLVAPRLIEYLVGTKDFYKVIKSKDKVEIQAYNLHESLNLPFEEIKPKARVPKLKLPTRLIEVVYQEGSQTTLLVTFNEGWQISFRIHNASSRIEPSLKFDINLVSTPHTLFTNQLFLG